MSENVCKGCGAPEIETNTSFPTPRTVYACGSSDYDQRPGTFVASDECHRRVPRARTEKEIAQRHRRRVVHQREQLDALGKAYLAMCDEASATERELMAVRERAQQAEANCRGLKKRIALLEEICLNEVDSFHLGCIAGLQTTRDIVLRWDPDREDIEPVSAPIIDCPHCYEPIELAHERKDHPGKEASYDEIREKILEMRMDGPSDILHEIGDRIRSAKQETKLPDIVPPELERVANMAGSGDEVRAALQEVIRRRYWRWDTPGVRPTEFDDLGIPILVKLTPREALQGAHGTADPASGEIRLAADQLPLAQITVLIHEMMHLCEGSMLEEGKLNDHIDHEFIAGASLGIAVALARTCTLRGVVDEDVREFLQVATREHDPPN